MSSKRIEGSKIWVKLNLFKKIVYLQMTIIKYKSLLLNDYFYKNKLIIIINT